MKVSLHLCLTSHPEHLGRWRQAFPAGRFVSSLSALPVSDTHLLLWLHTVVVAQQQPLDTLLKAISNRLPQARIIVISNTPSQAEALRTISAGATGYCHAQAGTALMQQISTVVANGGLWIGAELMDRLLAAAGQVFTPQLDHSALASLTPRERDVALDVARGNSNREIASSLNISERTVKAHLSVIFSKLDIRDRLQLVVLLRHETISQQN